MIRDNRNFAYDLRDVCDSREAPGEQLPSSRHGVNDFETRRGVHESPLFCSTGTCLVHFAASQHFTAHRFGGDPHSIPPSIVPPDFSFLPRLLNS